MMAREQHLVLTRAAAAEGAGRPVPGGPYVRLRRHRRWLVPLLAVVLLAQMAVAMVTTAVQQTPTIDEPVYVATATDYLHEHRIRYNPEHPPLGKLLIAAGVAVADPRYDPSYTGTQGDVGRHLLYESGNDPGHVMLWARLPVIALTLLFGLVAFAFARDLTGTAGGLAALALYTFSPDLIAHGSLATLDVPAAGFVLTAAWLVWRARRRPGLYLPAAGACLGAAVATKMSALPAVPVLMALAATSVLAARRSPGLPRVNRPATDTDRNRQVPQTGRPDPGLGPAPDKHPAGAPPATDTGREQHVPKADEPEPNVGRGHDQHPAGERPDAGNRRERGGGSADGPPSSTGPARRVLSAFTGLAVQRVRPALAGRGGRGRAAALSVIGGRRKPSAALGGALVVVLVALAVVWAAYLAVDPGLRFSPAEPVPALHGPRGRLVDLLPVPEAYRAGMRVQFGLEAYPWQGYLFGHVYTGSLWYYLPAALLVKTPLGLLTLGVSGAVTLVAVRRLRPAAPYVLLPPAVLLAAAMTGSRDFGTRYALFVPMFLAVAAACVPRPGRRWTGVATAALVLCTAVSSVRTFPYYLPYSNEAFGGPARTHRLLHDSNVDWGQDLGRLADRLRQRYPGERVWLVYKGSGVPSYYGIRATDPRTVPVDRVHGLLVVSDSAVAKARGRLAELIDSSRPAGDVGHSISLFRR
ncbi:phospholipid carrier-dependent glycosyltransferase [Streptomyces sp. NPDC048191]|uniref:phospholipid carrier-dependent glycosyltransferase n=1 Tax=Streptomyces sp. NPDC048191 TaxID=3155484 RepID=UPI0033DC4EFE